PPTTLRPTARSSATTAPSKDRSSSSSTRRPRCWSEPSPTSSSTTTTSATTRASATSPPPMSTTAAGTRSWPKERRSQTGPYSNDGTTIGPAGSERRPPRCPLTKGPKSPKVADDVHLSPGKQAAAVALAPYTAKNEFTTCRRATTTSAHRGQDYAGRTVFMSGTENRGRSLPTLSKFATLLSGGCLTVPSRRSTT